MRRFRTVTVIALLLVPIVAGGFLLQQPPARATPQLFDDILKLVSTEYVDTLSNAQLYEDAAGGLVHELNDPYSELLTPRDYAAFNRGTGGRYGGTGMYVQPQGSSMVVYRVFPHTPAEKAGVLEGDRILAIDGESTDGWSLERVSNALRGAPGSKVMVTYVRTGLANPITLALTRAEVHVPAVLYTALFHDRIGYIPLQTFNDNAAEEVRAAVRQLEDRGARGIVLDMRDNGGGIVDQALQVSSLFLPESAEIVSVRSRGPGPDGKTVDVARSQGHHIATQIPLAVLINGNSASATEIVAGALQDHDRALIVGEPSFGKGLVQSLYPLQDGYALKLTTGKWFTPSGRSIHKDREFVDGHFVVTPLDSAAADSARHHRPTYRSDDGRVVYGGGGITPDVIVPDDTLSMLEQEFLQAISPKGQVVRTVIAHYALQLKPTVKPDFVVPPAWTEELMRRVQKAGVRIDSQYAQVAPELLTQELEHRLAHIAFGDAATKERELARDPQLSTAIRLLEQSSTQAQLFTVAQSSSGR